MATLVFLGRLEDIAGAPELSLPLAQPATIATIAGRLPPELAEALRNPRIRIAVNGSLANAATAWDLAVADGDEVAFLPPVSGG
jgi:molybdopterin synthase sulfur carrier subunit